MPFVHPRRQARRTFDERRRRITDRHLLWLGPCGRALRSYGSGQGRAESSVRYIAAELGPKHIRANAISPGPISTRAASGIEHFDELLAQAAAEAPEHRLVSIEDVGELAAFLVSDSARMITGTIIPVDGGQHVLS